MSRESMSRESSAEKEAAFQNKPVLLGDPRLCTATVFQEARKYSRTLFQEVFQEATCEPGLLQVKKGTCLRPAPFIQAEDSKYATKEDQIENPGSEV